MFFRGSRYEPIAEAEIALLDGRIVRYKRARFVPDVRGTLPHIVADGERLDLIAYRYYQDPEQFWRVCDANLALRPDDLLDPGGRLLVPIPLG